MLFLDTSSQLSPYARRTIRARRSNARLPRACFRFHTGPVVAARGDGECLGSEIMATGVVKWFNMAKGFGFIAPDGGGQDVFVHVSAVERSGLNGLKEGQQVSFDVENDPRKNKPAAVNIKAV
ncbi:MAG TPA: cold-shock protein [Vitreimonas sp.]|nr:cold-shock protein [Vitreimonas sp.]